MLHSIVRRMCCPVTARLLVSQRWGRRQQWSGNQGFLVHSVARSRNDNVEEAVLVLTANST